MGTGFFFLGVMRQLRDADHSPPSSAKVKKEWSYSSTRLLYAFLAWTGTNLAVLHGINKLYVDRLLELRWIVELIVIRTRTSVCSKGDSFRNYETRTHRECP